MVWSGIAASVGGNLVGGLLGGSSAKKANKAAAAEAQANRDFQERMSSTAYQRGMADMKAAGLNPILAYKTGGASSPHGSMAPVQGELEPLANSARTAVTRAMEVANLKKQNENLDAQNEHIRAQSDLSRAQAVGVKYENVGRSVDAQLSEYVGSKAPGVVGGILRGSANTAKTLWKYTNPKNLLLPFKKRK